MHVRKLLILAYICFTMLLTACNNTVPIDGASLEERWKNSANNSAVSWWYIGESEGQYFIVEKWPTNKTVYSVPKQALEIKGIQPFQSNSGDAPVNLKEQNIVFR